MNTMTDKLFSKRLQEVLEPSFHPGELRLSEVGRCKRAQVLRVLGYEAKEFNETTAGYFEGGNIHEDYVVNLYRKAEIEIEQQITVPTPYGATGHADIDLPDGTIVEVKYVGKSSFENGIPKDEHIWQVMAYLHFLGRKQGELVYVTSHPLRCRAIPVYYTEEAGQQIEATLSELRECIDTETLPPIEFEPDAYPCSWFDQNERQTCPYFEHCHANTYDLLFPVTAEDAMLDLIQDYVEVKAKIAECEASVKELDKRKKDIERLLHEQCNELGSENFDAGAYKLRRVTVKGRQDIDWSAACKTGAIPAEVMDRLTDGYRKDKSGYSYFLLREAN